jgi:uncharacterized protein (DUF1778 family)
MKSEETSRFDTKLSKKQKEYFEYAAKLGGYKTLSEFIIHSAQEKASEIVRNHEQLLKSEKDREIFFEEILHPHLPNPELKRAAEEYLNYLNRNGVSDKNS